MSKRFVRWIETWIAANLRPGEGGDVEPYEVRAGRLADALLAEATTQGFRQDEIDEEAPRVPGMIQTKLATKPEFDLSQFGTPGDD